MFDRIAAPPADPVFEAMARYNADRRPERMDLGIGVFHDEHGESPVLAAVAEAEEELARARQSKAYLPLAGDPRFLEAFASLVFPNEKARAALIQSTGGTGAVRLALELVKLANPFARVHLGLPSWPNHASIADAVGLELRSYRYAGRNSSVVDFEAAQASARSCATGDVFILHGPGHNPTGLDLTRAQRDQVLRILAERGAVPIIDVAYWGLCDGLEADLDNLREDVNLIGEVLVAVSCSKAFGLYRERVGALFALTQARTARSAIEANLERISRVLVSTAPAHGAAVIARILADQRLRMLWATELSRMRERIIAMRAGLGELSSQAPQLAHIPEGRGLFSLLPISPEDIAYLSSEHAIHMPASGRINITGLKTGDPERFARALQELRHPRT
ncbi:MAG: aromatic amino acid transaminase [Sphingomicrobium sp.]